MKITKYALVEMKDHFIKSTEQGGLLVGHPGIVETFWPMGNIEKYKRSSYDFDRNEYRRLCNRARRRGMIVVGIVHTHPGGPQEPSKADVDCASRRYTNAVWSDGAITFYNRSGTIPPAGAGIEPPEP